MQREEGRGKEEGRRSWKEGKGRKRGEEGRKEEGRRRRREKEGRGIPVKKRVIRNLVIRKRGRGGKRRRRRRSRQGGRRRTKVKIREIRDIKDSLLDMIQIMLLLIKEVILLSKMLLLPKADQNRKTREQEPKAAIPLSNFRVLERFFIKLKLCFQNSREKIRIKIRKIPLIGNTEGIE